MRQLCNILGGSHLYGIANENSDLDYRGVFCNTETSKILGLDRFDCKIKQDDEEDSLYFEIRHFLNLLRKTNTQVLEILFAPQDKFLALDGQFKELAIDNRNKFVDTKRFFRSISGYMHGERRLVNGERKGQIGKKRYELVKKYGYSPKNLANYIRLGLVAQFFFETGVYIVDCSQFKQYDLLKKIRESPESFSIDEAITLMDDCEECAKNTYNNRNVNNDLEFNEKYANKVLLEIYRPFL